LKFEAAHLDEIAATGSWIPLRRRLGISAFGINAWRAGDAGEEVIGEHEERSGQEELYLVLSGHATFTVDGETVDGPPGTIVFVRDPSARRQAIARDAGTTILAVGAKAGEAYAPLAWEENADVLPHFEREEYGEAKTKLLEALERHPGAAGLLYNLACAEARLGELEPARLHLDEAIAAESRFAATAETDPDLEPLRLGVAGKT
jgi:hypothetical protein